MIVLALLAQTTPNSEAMQGAALVMFVIVTLVISGFFAAAITLRNRARKAHKPEHELLEELSSEKSKHGERSTHTLQGEDQEPWEKKSDWWKT